VNPIITEFAAAAAAAAVTELALSLAECVFMLPTRNQKLLLLGRTTEDAAKEMAHGKRTRN
jgi:hypothetical protein